MILKTLHQATLNGTLCFEVDRPIKIIEATFTQKINTEKTKKKRFS